MRHVPKFLLLLSGISVVIFAALLYRSCRNDRRESQWELLTILGTSEPKQQIPYGRWRQDQSHASQDGGAEGDDQVGDLLSLPYLQGYKEAPEQKNVTIHDPGRAYEGLNLYNSGHAPEAIVMDMNGKVLHEWKFKIEDVWPEVPATVNNTFWRRVRWFPDGSILAIWEGIGIVKLDRNSNLLWEYRGGVHHQAFVTEDGNIFVLSRRVRIIPDLNPEGPVLEDRITILGPDGTLREQHSVLEGLEKSAYHSLLKNMPKLNPNIFHTNSIYVFDGRLEDRSPFFKEGNVLISMLSLDTIAILDPGRDEIVWARSGRGVPLWRHQHDARPLANGNFLLFDNLGDPQNSKVIEFEPFSGTARWQFVGGRDGDLFTKTCGTSQRLPNGNTLITESDNGRAFEVTPGKDIVWEFFNPHRAGEKGRLIATLFEMVRVDEDYFPWLEK